MKPPLLLVGLAALVSIAVGAGAATAGADSGGDRHHRSYEVWLIDQEDRFNAGVGTLHVFDGGELTDDAASAEPESTDLGMKVAPLCLAETGTAPARPHMLVFNGGDDDGAGGNTHAVIAYVGSGHIAFLDAATPKPIDCIDVRVQAHAAWPTPDQRHLIVANQNGKKLQRIATDYRRERFTLEDDATIDLATCTTPSGAPCEHP